MSKPFKVLKGVVKYGSGADAIASAGRVVFGHIATLPSRAKLLLILAFGLKLADDFVPTSNDPEKIFRESKRHYGITDAEVKRHINGSYVAFNFWSIVSCLALVIGIITIKDFLIVPIFFIGMSIICSLRAFLSMTNNWILRNQQAPGLKAILKSPDRLPQKAS